MKNIFLHKIYTIGIVFISIISYAQQPTTNTDEQKQLAFQQYFFEALKQKAMQNYSKAIENLENCNQLDSLNVAVAFELSKNYLHLKKYFEAEIFIDKALNKSPLNEHLILHKVAIYKAQKNFNAAIETLSKLAKTHAVYKDDLVLLFIENQNFEAAEKLISDIENNGQKSLKTIGYKEYLLKRNQNNNTQLTILTTQNGSYESLKSQFNASKNYEVLKQLLNTAFAEQQYNVMYEDSKTGIELYPAQPLMYLQNAIALNHLKKYNEAINVLTIGIDFVIDDTTMEANFYKQLSIAYIGINNKNEADKYKNKAIELSN